MTYKIHCPNLHFLSLLIVLCSHSFGQSSGVESPPDSGFISKEFSDSAEISGNSLDTVLKAFQFPITLDSFQQWKESGDFDYMKFLDSLLRKGSALHSDTTSIDNSTGKRRTARENEATQSLLNSDPIKVFFWALAIFFIAFIVYKIFLTGSLFARKNKRVENNEDDEIPDTLEAASKYYALISEAESRNDFNLSTRYLYLQTIKMLIDRDMVSYSPGKTNYSYVKELTGKSFRDEFASLTLNYEYVWYGKFAMNADQYKQLKLRFISFNQKVS